MNDFMLSETPYPGLRAFNDTEADIFFGREEQSDRLLEKLGETRFISVVGLSGCGKSSLVRAGLIPDLESGFLVEAGPYWRIATMRPSNSPMRHLAAALLEGALREIRETDEDALPFLLAALRRGPLGLVEAIRETPLPDRTNLLIVVDQFEELFRHHREGGSDESEAFVNLLLESAKQTQIPIYIVITMRSEYIGDCALFHGLPELMNEGQFLVPRLSREQQEMAIVGPAGLFGGEIEDRLVNNLLNEMGSDPDQLPLLQHCLMRMWTRKSKDEQPEDNITLTLDDYEAVGELKDALSKHADEAFAEVDAHGQHVAELMFRCLSEQDPSHRSIRRPVSLREAAIVAGSEAKVKEVIEVFRRADRCFLMPNARIPLTADSVIDISHESLIRQWQRMKNWTKEEANSGAIYRSLEKRAEAWQQSRRNPKWLWDSPDLDIALHWKQHERPNAEWAMRYGEHFPLAMEFLDASIHAKDEKRQQEEQALEKERHKEEQARDEKRRQQERDRRRSLVMRTVIIGLLITLSLAGWALVEGNNARLERNNAQEAQKVAEEERQKAETQADKALDAEKKAKAALAAEEAAREEAEKSRIKAEEERGKALEAEKNTQEALAKAEQQRLLAEKAQAAAEVDAQLALEREKESQQKGESLKQIVDTSFGFLVRSGDIDKFIQWSEREEQRMRIDDLVPILALLLDSSEKNTELWQAARTKMDDDTLKSLWNEECRSGDKDVDGLDYEHLGTLAPKEQEKQWDECYAKLGKESQERLRNGALAGMSREEQLELLASLGKEKPPEVPVEPHQDPTQSTVTIHTEPANREITIGGQSAVTLSADTDDRDLQFHWGLNGPGSFDGASNSQTLFYIPPKIVDQEKSTVAITLAAKDREGETIATDQATLTLLVPVFGDLPAVQLLTIARNCLAKSYLTTPKAMNALDICKIIVKKSPRDPEAEEIMLEMAERYKSWGDQKYESCQENPENQRNCKDAITLYQRYLTVTDHIKSFFQFASQKNRQEARNRLEKLEEMFE